ncbi:MAG: DUF4982 domain-containing protein [Akkermansia sp.]|nr:DUF4982 domain-containing protein [Akkermansia sp.]
MNDSTRKTATKGWRLGVKLAALVALAGGASAAELGRTCFDDGWHFKYFGAVNPAEQAAEVRFAPAQPDYEEAAAPAAKAPDGVDTSRTPLWRAGFRAVQLPHDWAIESPTLPAEPNETGKLPWNGFAWYRKSFEVPADFSAEAQRWYLDFDGVMSHPKVFVNGKLAGEWAYGYSSFRVDMTPYLEAGRENLVAVEVSNLPLSTRWYPGAGIYRHVWLVKKQPVHVAQWGVHVTTPEVSAESATVCVETTVENTGAEERTVQVCQQLGETTAEAVSVAIPAGESRTVAQTMVLPQPKLWSTEHPELYTLATTVRAGESLQDGTETRFGVRRAEWRKEGFFLNGQRVMLNGVCEHHDFGGLGAAFHAQAYERKIRKLKEMGCNAIRMSHNPPAPEVLDLCDRYGMLVVDELFDIWQAQKYDRANGYSVDWARWWRKDVRQLVMRDRNHPCIIMWTGGNEVTECAEPEGVAISAALRAEFRKYDTTRPYSVACHTHEVTTNGFADTLDVVGFNYRPWFYQKFRELCPNTPFFGSETTSCLGTRDNYIFPLSWDQTEGNDADYQVCAYGTAAPIWGACPDVEYKVQDAIPDVAGMFVWTGFDYYGEPTPYNRDETIANNFGDMPKGERKALIDAMLARGEGAPSRSSYFGIIDLAGFPKDIYYLYQSRWRPELPQAHILPHWNWAGREGQVTPVMVFSSGDEAELFLNGKSQGVRRRGEGGRFKQNKLELGKNDYRFVWEDVIYEPGTLEVVVKKDGQPWCRASRCTAGPAVAVRMQPDRKALRRGELAFIELDVTDAQGNIVPTDNSPVCFSIEGPAELLGFCNGDPTDPTGAQDKEQRFFHGRLLAIVRATQGCGEVRVKVSSAQLGEHLLNLHVEGE